MEITYSRSSVGYLLGDVQIWDEVKVCGFLCLCLPDSTWFYLGVSFRYAACFLGGSKHSPYIHNLQWQYQPNKSLDCLLMPRDCWPIQLMWLKMTHTDSCWLMLCKAVLCLVNLSLTLSYVLSNEKDMNQCRESTFPSHTIPSYSHSPTSQPSYHSNSTYPEFFHLV